MAISRTEVRRESISQSPISNTELNFDRLPRAEDLLNMELRFRDVPLVSSLIENHLVGTFGLSVCFGSFYASAITISPDIFKRLLEAAKSIEGMSVVGGMLAGLTLVLFLCLFFLTPAPLRVAICGLSLPVMLLGAFHSIYGIGTGEAAVGFGLLSTGALCKRSLLKFHKSWISADPRMTTQEAKSWMTKVSPRWKMPSLLTSCLIVWRYLSHAPSYEAAPGIWKPPSHRLTRIWIASLVAGCAFSVCTGWQIVLPELVVWLAGAIVTSLVLLVAFLVFATGEACGLDEECEGQFTNDTRTTFQRHSDRLRKSEQEAKDPITGATVREAAHLFLGFEPWQRFPIVLHDVLLGEHVYVSGRTGSGKTSMALMSLLIQLLRGNREPGGWSKPKPFVVVDLKGDPALFQTAKKEAAARGQKFRFLTLEPGKASFYFNPFVCFKSASTTTPQLVQMVLDALGLFYGFEYGRGHFSQGSRFMLSEALRNPAGVNNFRDLYARLQTLATQRPKEFEECRELRSVVESLTHYEQLVTTDVDELGDDTIRFDRMLEDREVLYFWLPTTKESITVTHIGRLVLFCLRVAAHNRQEAGEPKRDVVLMIDEFQKLASEHFEKVLQQARSSGIGAILANQSIADLKTIDRDLVQTVRTNTRVKLFFSITEPDEIEAFRELSGEEVQTYGVGEVEEIRSRLSTKDLAALSDHPKRLLLQITSGSGYTQFAGLPIPVETDWPISKELSDERAALPWPSQPRVRNSVPRHWVQSNPQAASTQVGQTPIAATAPSQKQASNNQRRAGSLKGKNQSKQPPSASPVSPAQQAAIANTIKNLMNP